MGTTRLKDIGRHKFDLLLEGVTDGTSLFRAFLSSRILTLPSRSESSRTSRSSDILGTVANKSATLLLVASIDLMDSKFMASLALLAFHSLAFPLAERRSFFQELVHWEMGPRTAVCARPIWGPFRGAVMGAHLSLHLVDSRSRP